jgi:hypothetical protein
MHSVCFDEMPTTMASFDLEFTFDDLEVDTRTESHDATAVRDREVADFIRQNARSSKVVDARGTRYAHHLLATLTVDSYYSSIDEARAELSKDALELLRDGDVHAFFTGCGSHYIRSVNRRSYFLTIFTYTSNDRARDETFEVQLEQQVRRFHGDNATGDAAVEQRFSENARAHELRIVTRSIGLTARKDANLIPFDLASYKDAVKDAFMASQDEHAGRVVSMEITPWLSNARVLVSIDGGRDRASWALRRRILSENAEFYIELWAATHEIETQVQRAEACRRELDQDVLDAGVIRATLRGAFATSHRSGETLRLATLVAAVSDANLDRMRAIARDWRLGADRKSGASACLGELERTGLSGVPYEDIPACDWQRIRLPAIEMIEEYCPPMIEAPPAP